jgi:hypothetical protein
MSTESGSIEVVRALRLRERLWGDMNAGKAADLITQLRAERDAAAREMRERCAEVAETANRANAMWLKLCQTMAPDEAMRQAVASVIRALPDAP